MRYRKKPVVIEAVQFKVIEEISCKYGVHKEYNDMEISNFMGQPISAGPEPDGTPEGHMIIKTLEGDMKASEGDYIIKGVNGEFYPCKPDIFHKTYEPVEGGE